MVRWRTESYSIGHMLWGHITYKGMNVDACYPLVDSGLSSAEANITWLLHDALEGYDKLLSD